ncbi:hypothetical protein MJ575_10950 [Klebsiella pneumoniae]|nr:hypothetical protein MJ575_10950 [Klebsiella pneumoniae]
MTRFKAKKGAKARQWRRYGGRAAVWTHRYLSRAHRAGHRLKAGSVFVNNYNDGDMTVSVRRLQASRAATGAINRCTHWKNSPN